MNENLAQFREHYRAMAELMHDSQESGRVRQTAVNLASGADPAEIWFGCARSKNSGRQAWAAYETTPLKYLDAQCMRWNYGGYESDLAQTALSPKALACRRKFLRIFPDGFRDETYVDWERGYKWRAHVTWAEQLGRERLARLLARGQFAVIAQTAITIESRTNLLFSFEKMALRDALRTRSGARDFARGLSDLLYGSGAPDTRFERWCDIVAGLPRKQTRVLTWPIVTVFPFIAAPREHIFLKPMVTRTAAGKYGVDFRYTSAPNWLTYESMQRFAAVVRRDLRDLRPRDMIDLQSFIWIQGSDEYA